MMEAILFLLVFAVIYVGLIAFVIHSMADSECLECPNLFQLPENPGYVQSPCVGCNLRKKVMYVDTHDPDVDSYELLCKQRTLGLEVDTIEILEDERCKITFRRILYKTDNTKNDEA